MCAMALVPAVLLLMLLWVASSTGSGSKAGTGRTREETTALSVFPKSSWRWLASDATHSVPFNTLTRRFQASPKAGREHTGGELAKTKPKAHTKASGRSTAYAATEKRTQEGSRQTQSSSSNWKTTSALEASIIGKVSSWAEGFFSNGNSSHKNSSRVKQRSHFKTKSSGEHTSSPCNISACTQRAPWPATKPESSSHFTTRDMADYEEQTGSTMISVSTVGTEVFTGVPHAMDHWPWWKFQTEIQTESTHNSSICQKNLTSCVRNGTVWCGRADPLSCSCDVNCKVYGDCCADFADVCPSLTITATSRFRRHSGARVVCPAVANHLLLCSDVSQEGNLNMLNEIPLCKMEKWQFGSIWAVTNAKTRISYITCNNSMLYLLNIIPWDAEIFFLHSDDFDLNDAEAIHRELQAMDKVVMVAHPPSGVEGRPCVPGVIRTCPVPDEKMRQACSTVTSYVRYPATSEVFANKFCMACHGLDSCEALNASALKPRDPPSRTSAFIIRTRLEGEVLICTLDRMFVSISSHVKWQRVACAIEKKVVRNCTFTACIANHELHDGACVHVNRSFSVLVFVHHDLTQNASTDDASPMSSALPHRVGSSSSIISEVILKFTSQVFSDVIYGRTQVNGSSDSVWDSLVSLTFWSRLSDRQLSVAMETLTSNASRMKVRESLEERGLVGRVSLCVRMFAEEKDTACGEENFSFLLSKQDTPPGQHGSSSSQSAGWASIFVVIWSSLALTVLF